MCNAWNHPPECNCAWSGGGGNAKIATTEQSAQFKTSKSYVNPNALCPVCRATVFYYQSPLGGRVFFNDLGWPWPKHECTDHPQAQNNSLIILSSKSIAPFRNRAGEKLRVYQFLDLTENDEEILLRLFFYNKLCPIRLLISRIDLHRLLLMPYDLRSCPSFIVRTYQDHRIIEFIVGRMQEIISLKVPRAKPISSSI